MQLPQFIGNFRARYYIWWLILLLYTVVAFYASYWWIPDIPGQYEIKRAQVIESDLNKPIDLDQLIQLSVKLPDWQTASELETTSLWYSIPLQRQPIKTDKLPCACY